MLLHSMLRRGQGRAEQAMLDSCTVSRPTRAGVDPLTGRNLPGDLRPVWSGPCRIKRAAGATSPESADATVLLRRREVHIPAGAPRAHDGDVIDVAGHGYRYRVIESHYATLQTAQRLIVEEVTSWPA